MAVRFWAIIVLAAFVSASAAACARGARALGPVPPGPSETHSQSGQLSTAREAGSPDERLQASDKAEVEAALELKSSGGDSIWPGYAAARTPIVLFGPRYEFFMGPGRPPSGWAIVAGDDFGGRPYFRREAKDAQAFAVKVGKEWTGCAPTLALMNGKSPLKLGADIHVVMILHETFHAFQADKAPGRFRAALADYKSESRYPFKDKDFAAAWTEEGAALAAALKAADNDGAARLARKFLEVRQARRERVPLDADLLAYEQDIEWLEGLAEYAELGFYELAGRGGPPPSSAGIRFATRLPFMLQWDFVRLERQLGSQDGDLRFYLSGMAQARLLDRFAPGWKSKTPLERVRLEDLLRAALPRASR